MTPEHHFEVSLRWTGNRGTGTSGTRDFSREHLLQIDGKPDLLGSAAPVFRGDADRWNPEELLIAALAQCHMMSYFYVATRDGIVVTDYTDAATGTIRMRGAGGSFTSVTLRPRMTIAAGDLDLAHRLHDEAEQLCFIAQSVNFPVIHEPEITLA
ncbi:MULTISPECIES: OsmC family protein [unclassified Diaminobutyricimonas]|uniref:OsmC family protein n=1 Tax=unclassified Diaminobutyricimonas TaxID=2643261 RepID=UPI0012F4CF66|nr:MULTISPECIES: OsmC family protein [unclassified Diaminobutyricimonas]